MLRRIAAVLFSMLLSAPALADQTIFVTLNGVDAPGRGGTLGTALRTISYVNQNAPQPNTANGDVYVYIGPGGWGGGAYPNPVSVPADGKRFFFLPLNFAGVAGGPIAPDMNTILPSVKFTKTYLSIIGFNIQGNVQFDSTAWRDSLSHCYVRDNLSVTGAKYCTAYKNRWMSRRSMYIGKNEEVSTITNVFSYVENEALNLGKDHSPTQADAVFYIGGGNCEGGTVAMSKTDSVLLDRNNTDITLVEGAQFAGFAAYHSYNLRDLYGVWTIHKEVSSYDIGWKVRSGSQNPLFNGTQITVDGPGEFNINMTQTNGDASCAASDRDIPVKNVTVDSSSFRVQNGTPMRFYSGMRWANVSYTTLSSGSGPCITATDSIVGVNTINHVTAASPISSGSGSIYLWDMNKWHASSTLGLTNNIYSVGDTTASLPGVPCGPPWSTRAGVFLPDTSAWSGKVTSNNNLYANYAYSAVLGDHSLAWFRSSYFCSTPLAGGPWRTTFPMLDVASKFGNPSFAAGAPLGSPPGAGFNPAIGTLSLARGMGSGPSDAGSTAYVNQPHVIFHPGLLEVACAGMSPGSAVIVFVTVENIGAGNLTLLSATTGDPEVVGEVNTSPLPTGVHGNVLGIAYEKKASNCGTRTGVLTVNTSDPARPVVQIPWYLVGE